MSYRVLIADDFEDMRELLEFVVTSELGCRAEIVKSGNEAIAVLKKDPSFDLVLTDLNMPDGTGADLYKAYVQMNLQMPFIVLSGDSQSQHPALSDQKIKWLNKPFEIQTLVNQFKKSLSENAPPEDRYVPVALSLLTKIGHIETPLYIRINDKKFVQITRTVTDFPIVEIEKYRARGIQYLYVEASQADEFIATYRKRVLSIDAWQGIQVDEHEMVSLNNELLKNVAGQMGWENKTIELAKDSIQKALHVAKTNKSLSRVVERFHKIERFGMADHCTLALMVSCGILQAMGFDDEVTLSKMTFASILHDMSLSEVEYDSKSKIIRKGLRDPKNAKEATVIIEHPIKSAELCSKWDFCPPEVDEIIKYHHERPDGQGFPYGKTASELSFLCSAFIIAEDFADYFIQSLGKPDLNLFVQTRKAVYTNGHFKGLFRTLVSALQNQNAA